MVSIECPDRGPASGDIASLCRLLASLPAAVAYVAGPDMVFEFASDGFRQALGGQEVIGRPFGEVLPEVVGQPPFEALRKVLQTGQPRQARGQEVRACPPGSTPTYMDSVYQPVRDETGRVAGVLIFSTDVSDHVRDRQQLEELTISLRGSEERDRTLFETLPNGIIRIDRDGAVTAANPAAAEILGLAPDQMGLANRARITLHEDGTPYRPEELPAMVALRTGESVEAVVAAVRNARTDEIRWIRVTAVPDARDSQGQPLRAYSMFTDITEQRRAQDARQRAQRERAEMLAREQAAKMAAGAAQDRLALLLEASSLVAATASQEDLRDRLAKLIVPALADSYAVLLLTGQGALRTSQVVHRDPAKAAILEDLEGIDIPSDGPLVQAALTRATTQLITDVSAVLPGWASASPEVTGILRRIRPESAVIMPLLVGQRPVGVAVLGRGEDRPLFTETDVAVVEELSRRLAAGWASVETFAREHTVAETLQRALMPDAPADLPGLDLAVRYLPATGGVHVGGDWYDVCPLERNRVALAIGDVAGHSISSASVMGQVRSILRAYTLDYPAPADVLARTNAAVSQLLPDATATVFYAVLDVSTGDLAYANAGHPPPLVDNAEGQGGYLDDAPGVMLGASSGVRYTAGHRRLAPGARLLLYTDGLIEDRRRDIAEGFGALARAMRRSVTQTAERTCQLVQSALLGSGSRDDDVCILALRVQGQPAAR